jgi:hypothetical protein
MIGLHPAGKPAAMVISASPVFAYGSRLDHPNHLCHNHLYSRSAVVTKVWRSDVAVGPVRCKLSTPPASPELFFP